jgi:hypothetical protein
MLNIVVILLHYRTDRFFDELTLIERGCNNGYSHEFNTGLDQPVRLLPQQLTTFHKHHIHLPNLTIFSSPTDSKGST